MSTDPQSTRGRRLAKDLGLVLSRQIGNRYGYSIRKDAIGEDGRRTTTEHLFSGDLDACVAWLETKKTESE
jgi:hypothetical protein